jgi:hypothetical protein
MQFATLLSESRNYLKEKGYLKEAPGDEEEETTPADEGDAGGGEGEDALSWLDAGADSGGGDAGAEGGEVPPADAGGGDMGAGGGGGGAPGGDMGGEAPTEEAPAEQPAEEQPQEEVSAADAILGGDPPQEVLSVKGKLERLDNIVDEFMNNLDNANVNKELSVEEITNEIAGVLNLPEDKLKEMTHLVQSKMVNLVKKLKRMRRITVDPTNANKLQESIDNLRNYMRG